MKLLDKKQLIKTKKSDTLVVFGCGWSINTLTADDKRNLLKFDSIGFNWFAKSNIPTTYYLIREQANIPKRQSDGETPGELIRLLSKKTYKKTKIIVLDVSGHSPKALPWWDSSMLSHFDQLGIVLKDTKYRKNKARVQDWDKNIVETGVYHGWCTLTNVMHIGVNIGYRKFIFVGVDLYDSRYFWLDDTSTRDSVKEKKKDYRSQHAISGVTLDLIQDIRGLRPDLEMYTYNPKSLLKNIIPVWKK